MLIRLNDDGESMVNVTNVDTIKQCWKRCTVDGALETIHLLHIYFTNRADYVVYNYSGEGNEKARNKDCKTLVRVSW